MTSIAHYLANPDNNIVENEKQIPVYEYAGLHIVLKKIIAHDQILLKNKSEGKSNLYFIMKSICLLIFFLVTFSEILSSTITKKTLQQWVQCNRSCFLLIS